MKSSAKEPTIPAERDERLYDEKIRLVRPGRLIAGLAMISVAVIWLAVDNLMDPSPRQPAPSPTIVAGPRIPSISVAQPFIGGVADAVVQARPDRVNGRAASAGSSFLVLAIQVVNRSPAPLQVATGDFTLLTGTGKIGSGTALPGYDAIFAPPGIPAKATQEGDIVFSVPNTATTLVLVYLPRVRGAAPVRWAVPVKGA